MNILAIDDHELFRTGLKYLLKGIDNEVDYTEAASIEEAVRDYSKCAPELILLDYFMPDISGLTALQRARNTFETSTIVVLSSLDDPALIREAIDHGAAGFIPKASSQHTLISALKLILTGGIYLPRVAINTLQAKTTDCTAIDKQIQSDDIMYNLTDRQREVLMGVVNGKPNKVIAYDMNISEGTVKSHLSAVFKHLRVTSRTQAVILLAKHHSVKAATPVHIGCK